MTVATLLVLACAVLATLALFGWAWIWFAIRHEASTVYSLGDFDGMHFESLTPDRSGSATSSLVTARRP